MKKNAILFTFILVTISVNAQIEKLNNYKYAVVNSSFKYLKETDQYQTSSLTKFLLAKTGIPTFLDSDKLPLEFIKERCKGIFVSVTDKSSLLKTKSRIEFKDCYGATVFNTEYGQSNEKVYVKAYPKAIRSAFKFIENYAYQYSEKIGPKEIKSNDNLTVNLAIEKTKEVLELLYAQAKEDGYQLVNKKPEVVFFLLKTKKQNLFIIKGKNGIFYKKEEYWISETYENGKATIKKFSVKF